MVCETGSISYKQGFTNPTMIVGGTSANTQNFLSVSSQQCHLQTIFYFYVILFFKKRTDHFVLLLNLKEKDDYCKHLTSDALVYHICFLGYNALVVGDHWSCWTSYI